MTRIRNPKPRYTIIPVDLTKRQRRAIAVMAAANDVSFEVQWRSLIDEALR